MYTIFTINITINFLQAIPKNLKNYFQRDHLIQYTTLKATSPHSEPLSSSNHKVPKNMQVYYPQFPTELIVQGNTKEASLLKFIIVIWNKKKKIKNQNSLGWVWTRVVYRSAGLGPCARFQYIIYR